MDRQDLRRWLQLPDVAVEDFEVVKQFKSRLVGDPAFEYQTATSKINEEKRLAAIVASIHYDASTVPRGAYYRDAQHKLKQNPYFKGSH
jgi:radial spoke head protein 9